MEMFNDGGFIALLVLFVICVFILGLMLGIKISPVEEEEEEPYPPAFDVGDKVRPKKGVGRRFLDENDAAKNKSMPSEFEGIEAYITYLHLNNGVWSYEIDAFGGSTFVEAELELVEEDLDD